MNYKRAISQFVSALALVLAAASPVFANNGPGPLAFTSMLSLVILMVVLTFAGGGYNIMARLDDAKYPSKVKRTLMNTLEFIAGVVLFFVGIFATVFGVLGVSIYAIARGVKMLQWSKAAAGEGARPAHLEGANPARLRFAGIVLIVLTVLVFGYSMTNYEDVVGINPNWRKTARVAQLSAEVKNAKLAAETYLFDNPKAKVVTCEDLVKAGYVSSNREITCFSDLTATSGSIRMTGPKSWKLTNPVAVITFDRKVTPAER